MLPDGLQPQWIHEPQRITPRISIGIIIPGEPNRVGLDVTAGVDVIIAVAVVIVLCARKLLGVGKLAGEAQHSVCRIGDHRA